MRLRLLLFFVLTLTFAACATMFPPAEPPEETVPEEPATPPPPAVPDSASAEATPPASRAAEAPALPASDEEMVEDSLAAPDLLYAQTEDALRLAFTDGLFGLYRAEMNPADAQRLDRAGVQRWLTDLALVSPRAVEFARATLGPVLEQRFVVGFVLKNAAQVECASIRDVLYIPVPERFQGPDRAFTGYIIQDACDITSGDLAPFCAGGFGTSDSGTACGCTCTTGEAPAQPCVSC